MQRTSIKKSVQINAEPEEIWQVLTEDRFNRAWYTDFSEGSYAETDWKEGSKVLFKDTSGRGMFSKVVESKPNEIISMEHQGVLMDNKEVFDSEEAASWKGCRETYRISQQEGHCLFSVEQDIPGEYRDAFLSMWDKALNKIQELAERGL